MVPVIEQGRFPVFGPLSWGKATKVEASHRVYATPRYVKFNEMEYNIPLDGLSRR